MTSPSPLGLPEVARTMRAASAAGTWHCDQCPGLAIIQVPLSDRLVQLCGPCHYQQKANR